MQAKAVIFDIDGVLIDSYAAHLQSWQAVARGYGQQMTESDFATTFGQTSREIIRTLWGNAALNAKQIADFDAEKEVAFRELVATDYPWMPGAKNLLAALHEADFRLAFGSSGPPENVELALQQLDRRDWIGATVTGADVMRGKPDPEVFQLAAQRLAVAPSNCVVIEDACAGIMAANTASMLSVALVSTGHTRDEYTKADYVIEQLSQISPELIETWIDAQG